MIRCISELIVLKTAPAMRYNSHLCLIINWQPAHTNLVHSQLKHKNALEIISAKYTEGLNKKLLIDENDCIEWVRALLSIKDTKAAAQSRGIVELHQRVKPIGSGDTSSGTPIQASRLARQIIPDASITFLHREILQSELDKRKNSLVNHKIHCHVYSCDRHEPGGDEMVNGSFNVLYTNQFITSNSSSATHRKMYLSSTFIPRKHNTSNNCIDINVPVNCAILSLNAIHHFLWATSRDILLLPWSQRPFMKSSGIDEVLTAARDGTGM